MKSLLLLVITAAMIAPSKCNKKKAVANCFKGRLEIKGICSNYTISVLEGNMDPAKMETSWTDENTGKTYRNVFALGSPCNFPSSITEGQEFYFTIEETAQDCVVCKAYYPKPAKSLAINVLDQPCR